MQCIVICGAAGRDFHNFNTVYRDDAGGRVVAFTATQIPGIADRRYPASLAGALYPEGIAVAPDSGASQGQVLHSHRDAQALSPAVPQSPV